MSRRRTHSAGVISEHRRAVVRLRATGPQHPEGRRRHHRNRHRSLRHPQTDEELALHLAIEELRAFDTRQQDRALALRLQEQDRPPDLLRFIRRRRLDTARHPELPPNLFPLPAARNDQEDATVHPEQAGLNPIDVLRTFFGMVSRLNIHQPLTARLSRRQSSTSARLTGHDCVSCMDPIRGVEIHVPCNHYYDQECLVSLFEAATRDESLFPPRCCRQSIPLALVQSHMPAESLVQFKSRMKELRNERRVYCAKASCSRFLGPQYDGILPSLLAPTLKCSAPGCGTATCSSCKNEIKPRTKHRCGESLTDQGVLALGQSSGWARCPGCEMLIELTIGCYHMTCRCKAQFCYLCRARWKTCQCPQWEARRLLTAAEERADAQLRVERAAPIRRVRPRIRPPPLAGMNRDRDEPHPRRDVGGGGVADAPTRPVPVSSSRVARLFSVVEEEEDGRAPPSNAAAPAQPTGDLPLQGFDLDDLDTLLLDIPVTLARSPSITDPIDVADGASTVAASAGSQASSMVESSVAPLRWHKRVEEDSERRRTLTMRWVERLRQDHGCNHEKWTFQRGEGNCVICEEHIPVCYFRCSVCDMLVCRTCRWNRG